MVIFALLPTFVQTVSTSCEKCQLNCKKDPYILSFDVGWIQLSLTLCNTFTSCREVNENSCQPILLWCLSGFDVGLFLPQNPSHWCPIWTEVSMHSFVFHFSTKVVNFSLFCQVWHMFSCVLFSEETFYIYDYHKGREVLLLKIDIFTLNDGATSQMRKIQMIWKQKNHNLWKIV